MDTRSTSRIDDELYAAAELFGPLMGRSGAQQLAHWARIGREVEVAHGVSHAAVASVLDSNAGYDQLNAGEQAIARAEWSERMSAHRADTDPDENVSGDESSFLACDDDGHVVRRRAGLGPGERHD